jgi:hypothetical protein
MEDNEKTSTDSAKQGSSPWWGIASLLTAWTGLIGLVLGILALIKGVKKKTYSTANIVLGVAAILIAVGAMIFQLVFGIALIFGSSNDDLGEVRATNSSIGSLSYSLNLPSKFKQEKIEEDGDRYIYRVTDADSVSAILITSCTSNVLSEDVTEADAIAYLETYLKELPNDSEERSQFESSFGGVKNISVGAPEKITEGRYAFKGYAVTLFADHPITNESLYGEMHVMTVGSGMCAGAWLGTAAWT